MTTTDRSTAVVTSRTFSLADSHVHLDRYPPATIERLVQRATAAGVCRLLTVGSDLDSSRAAVKIASQFPGVCAAVGVHPRRVGAIDDLTSAIAELFDLASQAGVVAIGEVGLDAQANGSSLDRQRRFFESCIETAREVRLPLVLHVVDAHDEAIELLARFRPVQAVVHYFVGDLELAQRYMAVGCHISVGNPVTRPVNRALRAAVAVIPLDRLLLETDTYPLPGRQTEPADVRLICDAVSALRSTAPRTVAEESTASFCRLFRGHR